MYYDYFAKHRNTKIGDIMVCKMFQTLSTWISELHPQKTRVLEIGVGRAVFASCLRDTLGENLSYLGIEPNDDLRKAAESNGFPAIKAILPPFPESLERNSFDVVIISHVLEHFQNHTEALEVLKCVHDLLKPGGHFVLVYPDFIDWGNEFYNIDYSHSFPLTERRVDHLMVDSKFEVERKAFFRAHFYRCKLFSATFALLLDVICKPILAIKNINVIYKAKITFRRNGVMIAKKP